MYINVESLITWLLLQHFVLDVIMACGVLGIALKSGVDAEHMQSYAKNSMQILNHRGENAHGIAFIDGRRRIVARKNTGLVRDSHVFESRVQSPMLIGHTRYVTSSSNNTSNTQPIHIILHGLDYAVSHNGNIVNDAEIREELGMRNLRMSDTRTLALLLKDSLRSGKTFEGLIHDALEKVNGSYSMAILLNKEEPVILAIRDRFGFMPLSVGENRHGFFVASESVTFGKGYLNAESREVLPGEMVIISRNGMESIKLFDSNEKQFCMFQWIYMGRPESVIGGSNIYLVREMLGAKIALRYRPSIDFVVPVPDSGLAVAYGYAKATGMPIRMGLVKDRYESKRSFMQNSQKQREEVLGKKLNVVPEVVHGKRILLLDDSLVRGTTTKKTIEMLREAGAKSVHIAFSCPPIISQCGYGVDFYNEQLLARTYMQKEGSEMNKAVAKAIGADSLYYNTISDLSDAISREEKDLCLSCLTGVYRQPFTPKNAASRGRMA